MSGFLSLLFQEAIARATSASVSPLWEFNYRDSGRQAKLDKIRKYCPMCKGFDSLVDNGHTQKELKQDPALKRFKCKRCDHQCNTPAALKSQRSTQTSSGSSSGSGRGDGLINAAELSGVLNIIDALPADKKNWLLWMYGDFEYAKVQHLEGLAMAALAQRVNDVESDALSGLEQYANVLRLLHLLMLDFRDARRKECALKFRISVYAAAIGRDKAQFKQERLWGRVMREITRNMEAFDNEIMTEASSQYYHAVYEDEGDNEKI